MDIKSILLDIIKKYKIIFIIGVFTSICDLIFTFFVPYLNQHIIDNGIINRDIKGLLILCILLVIIYILEYAFTVISSLVFTKISKEFTTQIYIKMVNNLFTKQHSFFVNNNSGEILQRISESWQLEDVFSLELFQAFLSIISFIIALVLLLSISTKMTLLTLSGGMIIFILHYYGSRLLEIYLPNVLNINISLTSKLEEIISGIFDIKINSCEKIFISNLTTIANDKLKWNMKLAIYPSMYFNATTTFTSILLVGVLYISGIQIIDGKLTLGTYFMIISYVQMILSPTMQIGFIINTLKPVGIISKRLKNFFETEYIKNIDENEQQNNEEIKSLEIVNLAYSYNNKDNLFENINYIITKGKILTLKGKNGSGKSTLINILCGEYIPTEGQVLINHTEKNLKEYVAVANQHPFIFNKNLKDNIILSDRYDFDKYEKIIEKLSFNKYFSKDILSNNEIIEENGKNLSGGQKKLIAFARCIYKDKPILILDEIMSNMDINMRNIIINYLKSIKANKIIILVEHTNEYEIITDDILNI